MKNKNIGSGFTVPSFKSIEGMTPDARIRLFRDAQRAAEASFLTHGKIFASFGEVSDARTALLGAGLSNGAVSNAAYGGKTFRLANGKLKINLGGNLVPLDESAFDQLNFQQCVCLSRATDPGAKGNVHQPERDTLITILRHKAWDEELELFLKDGLTAKERKETFKDEPIVQHSAPAPAGVKTSPVAMPENVSLFPIQDEHDGGTPGVFPPEPEEQTVAQTRVTSGFKASKETTIATAMELVDELESTLNDLPPEEGLQVIARVKVIADEQEARLEKAA